MAFRSFGVLQIQSTTRPQPLVGSYITAGIGAPAGSPITLTLGTVAAGIGGGVTDAQVLFQPGDPAWIINADGSGAEPVFVSSVNAAANQITLGNQTTGGVAGNNPVTTKSHTSGVFGTGSFIALNIDVNNTLVMLEDGTGGTWSYIGVSYAMTATYRRIFKLPKVGSGSNPYYWDASEAFGGNPFRVSELWILGGAGNSSDGYTPSFCVL